MARLKQLPTDWTKHLPEGKERDDFKALVLNSRTLLDRLLILVDEKLDGMDRKEMTEDFYDSAYAFKQAHYNGRRSGLTEIRRLLEFLEN